MPIEVQPGAPKAAPPDDDFFWVAKARKGDPEAFRVLVERHSRAVFRSAYRMTRREDLADDIVQETFFKAYRSLQSFDGRSRFATWLHRIGVNCALDLLRRQTRREAELDASFDAATGLPSIEPPSVAPGPERLTLSVEIEEKVERALDSLTPIERAAFVLRHFEDQSIAEIGRVLGSRTSATKQAVFRAVRKLRQQLGPLIESRSHAVAHDEKGQVHAGSN